MDTTVLSQYRQQTQDRAALGIPPLPLTAAETSAVCDLLQNPPAGEEEYLLHLIRDRVPPGVDEAAYIKAGFLTAIAKGELTSPLISPRRSRRTPRHDAWGLQRPIPD